MAEPTRKELIEAMGTAECPECGHTVKRYTNFRLMVHPCITPRMSSPEDPMAAFERALRNAGLMAAPPTVSGEPQRYCTDAEIAARSREETSSHN